MKVLTKLLAEFVAWRWAPTVGLLSASVLFVLIVVGLVPSEIGVPVADSKFTGKSRATSAAGLTKEGPTTTAIAAADEDQATGRSAPSPVAEAIPVTRSADFGRRGFSPVLDRPEPPPAPPPPAPPPLPVVQQPPAVAAAPPATNPPQQSRVGTLFQRVQSAFGVHPSTPQPAPGAEAPAAPPNGAAPFALPPNGAVPPAEAAPPNEAAPPPEGAPPNGAAPPGAVPPNGADGGQAAPDGAPEAAPGAPAPAD